MKVTIVGAGPAGLYLAILLRRADPRHEVRVLERNAPDATFGWGVVFSEGTLGELRDADYPSYLEITDTFARWETVDIRYRGTQIRSRGNEFSAISRKQLLAILQRRATELGARLEFGHEVADADALAAECDVLVAADGVNSGLRNHRPELFGASVGRQGGKYVWFGTDLVLDAFTFIFRETQWGLVQVHAYPFDDHASTFIVECPEPVWRAAGLDRMTELESLAFCEELFAEDLDGHRLMSNRSVWLDFMHVRNRHWHRGNTVLLGDAAHTAHFSIGSGTKLAMEDAVALAKAFQRRDTVRAALADYQLERQPAVERFQQAAADSASWFERVGSLTRLEPIQFAFNLLTRSGRISHASLALRDPGFTRVLDSWFDARGGGLRRPLRRLAPAPLSTPLALGGLTIANRLVCETRDSLHEADGTGAGLALAPWHAVRADGRIHAHTPVAGDLEGMTGEVADLRERGVRAGVRIGHAGRRAGTMPPSVGIDVPLPAADRWTLLSASARRYGPHGSVPRAASRDDLDAVADAFAAAAARVGEAGFDVLIADFARGGLVASFLSPLTNRDGERLRFPLQVLAAVRAAFGGVLGVRLTIDDWAAGGIDEDEGVKIAQAMAADGADLIEVSAGQTVPEGRPRYRRGFLTALSARVRAEAGVPTLVAGHLTTVTEGDTVVAAGRGDLCVLALQPSELEDLLVPGAVEAGRP